MPATCSQDDCQACPLRVVCHCLRVTEDVLLDALTKLPIRNLRDIRKYTGAGDGCCACHAELEQYLELQPYLPSAEPICSVK
jgi:bacterioferritin-associated ferredoxin